MRFPAVVSGAYGERLDDTTYENSSPADDYLIQEFHEAGIFLPEEIEVLEAHREAQDAFGRMLGVQRHPLNTFEGLLGVKKRYTVKKLYS